MGRLRFTDALSSKHDDLLQEISNLTYDIDRYYRALDVCEALGINHDHEWHSQFLEQTGVKISTNPLDIRIVDPIQYLYAVLKTPILVEVVADDDVQNIRRRTVGN